MDARHLVKTPADYLYPGNEESLCSADRAVWEAYPALFKLAREGIVSARLQGILVEWALIFQDSDGSTRAQLRLELDINGPELVAAVNSIGPCLWSLSGVCPVNQTVLHLSEMKP
jgi:hypothetical protein